MNKSLTKTTKNNNSLDKAQQLLQSKILTVNTLLGDTNNLVLKNQITYVGIDFGTSTTVVSIATGDPKLNNLISKAIDLNQELYDGLSLIHI